MKIELEIYPCANGDTIIEPKGKREAPESTASTAAGLPELLACYRDACIRLAKENLRLRGKLDAICELVKKYERGNGHE